MICKGGVFFVPQSVPNHRAGWWYEYRFWDRRNWNRRELKTKSFGPFKTKARAEEIERIENEKESRQ
jgi:hypothetical protein